jgi:hypothetical protein
VDPLPKSWAALGKQVAALRGLAPEGGAVAKILQEVEGDVAGFGEMAKTQLSGQPLSVEQEERVWAYARAVEHPWVQLKSLAAAGGKAGAAELVLPEPPSKIVDVHHWPREGVYFHVAVGDPRGMVALIGDRGVRIPAAGVTYSYYELASPTVLNDADWRAQLPNTPRPAWVNP